LGGFAIGARVALLWQHNANPSSKLASIPRYDDIVRTAGWAESARVAGGRRSSPAGDRRATGGAPKTARRIRQGGRPARRRLAADWGRSQHYCGSLGMRAFHWWRSGNEKRTQNVSEYMLVLALCLVKKFEYSSRQCQVEYAITQLTKPGLKLLSPNNTEI